MKACGGCGAYIPDGSRFCPSCGGPQAEGPAAPASPGPAPVGPGEPPAPPPFDRGPAESRVRTLGVLYMVYGALLLAFVAWSFVNTASGKTLRDLAEIRVQAEPEVQRILIQVEEFYGEPAFLTLSHVIPFVLGILFLWAGNNLRSLRGRTAAIVAAVAALVLSLCQSCCCCLGIPLGIYALFVLTRGDTQVVTT